MRSSRCPDYNTAARAEEDELLGIGPACDFSMQYEFRNTNDWQIMDSIQSVMTFNVPSAAKGYCAKGRTKGQVELSLVVYISKFFLVWPEWFWFGPFVMSVQANQSFTQGHG